MMIFDKVGWPSRPPQSRNWKEKEMVIGTMGNCIYKVINQLEIIGLRLTPERELESRYFLCQNL